MKKRSPLRRLIDWLVEIRCVIFDHDYKHCGSCNPYTDYGAEWDDWWECRRCSGPSGVFDNEKFIGRLKAWWYQE